MAVYSKYKKTTKYKQNLLTRRTTMPEKQPIPPIWKYALCAFLGFILGAGIGIAGTKAVHSRSIPAEIQEKQNDTHLSADNTDVSPETKTGWILENEKWYCYADGTAQKNRWFYIGSDGAMCADTWQNIDGQEYFFASSGAMQTDEEIAASEKLTAGKNTAADIHTPVNEQSAAADGPETSENINFNDYIGYFENDEIKQSQGEEASINIREIRDSQIYGEYYFTYSYLTELGQFYERGIPINGDTFTIQEFRLYDEWGLPSEPHTVTLRFTRVNGAPALEFFQYDGEAITSSYYTYKGPAKEKSGRSEDPVGRYDFRNGYYIGDQGEPVYGLDGTVIMDITKVENNRVYGVFDFHASDDIIYVDFRENGIPVIDGTFSVDQFNFQFVHDFIRTGEVLLGFDTGLKWMIPKTAQPVPTAYSGWMKMTSAEIEAEVSRIRKVWQEDREAVTNGSFERRQWQDNVTAYFQNGVLKMIEVPKSKWNHYTKIFQIEDGKLTFAYYESAEMQMRLYYKDQGLFRWIQTDIGSEAVIHDQEDSKMFFENAQWAIADLDAIYDTQQ